MRLGYARVSTTDQDLRLQRERLKDAGCEKLFEEKISSAGKKRPELDTLLGELRRDDVLVVTRLDRPPKLRPDQRTVARQLIEEGKSVREVARTFNVHPATIYRCIDENSAL